MEAQQCTVSLLTPPYPPMRLAGSLSEAHTSGETQTLARQLVFADASSSVHAPVFSLLTSGATPLAGSRDALPCGLAHSRTLAVHPRRAETARSCSFGCFGEEGQRGATQ